MRSSCLAIICMLFMVGCDSSDPYPTKSTGSYNYANPDTFIYRDASKEELNEVEVVWATRDLSPRDVRRAYHEDNDGYSVTIMSHLVGANVHHAAILSPYPLPDTPLPVIVHAVGLNQGSAHVYVEYFIDTYPQLLRSFIQVIPSFRGQVMHYKDQFLGSTGKFCDAFDGPTDDAIASLNVAETVVPEGNYDKVLAAGGSRGGTVALLMAMRDNRINTVLATATPVDFYREEVRDLYELQYNCLFFSDRTESEARFSMMASSPILFEPMPGTENIFLFHGEFDQNAPLWNFNEMVDHLSTLDLTLSAKTYSAEHTSIYQLPEYREDFNAGVQQFLLNLEQ